MQKRTSLAVKVGLLSAVLSSITALLILLSALFFYQKVLKENLISQVETNISKVNDFILGFLYAQANWIHLEENQKFLNSLPNVSYTYIQDPSHIIDFGVLGLKSPEIGFSQPSWEPKLTSQDIKSEKYCFSAPKKAVDVLGDRIHLGEQICVLTSPIKYNDNIYGYIRVAVNFREISQSSYRLMIFALFISLLVGIAVAVCVIISTRRYFLPIRQLSQKMNSVQLLQFHASKDFTWNSQLSDVTIFKSDPEETAFLKSSLKQFLEVISESEKLKREAILAVIAHQVAHDIRSPLIALDIIIKDIQNMPEEQRLIIRNSANRINDIANNLLSQYKHRKTSETDETISNVSAELISDLLMRLLSEKRAQYKNEKISLAVKIEENSYGEFAKISASIFNRILSNLLDNSIEALADNIEICFSILEVEQKNQLLIQIKDNGCGILPKTLSEILNGESVSSKATGHGLGLSHAIKTIKNEWNGQFNIKSSMNVGTTVEIRLPKALIPNWFLSKLTISSNELIAILDDDESIHQVWHTRLNEAKCNFKLLSYYHPKDLLTLDKNILSSINIFLIDYEFIGVSQNGLDVIEELNIIDRSYLVTSQFEDLGIRNRCEKIGLKIIPKIFAVHIPIVISHFNNKIVDLIFIDDDISITDAWILNGLSKGKNIVAYNTIRSFKNDKGKFDLTTPIYIDSELNDVVKGQEYAKELYEEGFQNIYLTTGHSRSHFPCMFWIKDIVGKNPPF